MHLLDFLPCHRQVTDEVKSNPLSASQSYRQDHIFELIAAVAGNHYTGGGIAVETQIYLVGRSGLERIHKIPAVKAYLQPLSVALCKAYVLGLADGGIAQAVDEIFVKGHTHGIFRLFVDDYSDAVDDR